LQASHGLTEVSNKHNLEFDKKRAMNRILKTTLDRADKIQVFGASSDPKNKNSLIWDMKFFTLITIIGIAPGSISMSSGSVFEVIECKHDSRFDILFIPSGLIRRPQKRLVIRVKF
jgi:hypothetical protein